ncbi:MAG: FHA domain-containing protein [Planctomycetaceae bacterium]|nr:FHA domain-containing protein [Planctomycetaceae bacterium]
MASILILKAGESVTRELTKDETFIGRSPECDVQIESSLVSRKHAKLLCAAGKFAVVDLESGNGTTVNGVRISPNTPTPIVHDDRVKLGPILVRFIDPASAGSARAGSKPKFTEGDAAKPPAFDLNLTDEAEDSATITGAVESGSSSRFGALDVQPAAKLKGILEISRTLAGTVDLGVLLPKILDTLFTIFPGADRGCILLKDPTTAQMIPRAIKHRRPGEDESVKLSRTILNKVLTDKAGVLSADASTDGQFQASESIANFKIRSMMCVPLLGLDGEPLGIINIDTQNPLKQFQKDDLDLLVAVAGQAALSYENARLAVSYAEKQKQDSEMQIAADVQRALLPEHLPQAPGYEFFASYESAQAVGGDYYDCLLLPNDRVCLAFGDVAGKGVPASLVMSRLSSVVQNTLEFVQDVGQAAERINNHMCNNAIEGRFVTFTLAIIDMSSHTISLVIAGHMSPMIRRVDGTIEEFPDDSVGMPLGVAEGLSYDVLKRSLQPGETIVIYTDGVSEAMNPASDLYGVDRLRQMITTHTRKPAELGKAILADVKRHAAGRPQNDDITLMVFGRTADGDDATTIVSGPVL